MGSIFTHKRSKSALILEIEVLQNGELVAKTSKKLGSKKKVSIGSSFRSTLHIPFYPIVPSIPLFYTGKKKAYLKLDESWEGYLVKGGSLFTLSGASHRSRMIGIEKGDYGCFFLNNLQVIYKVTNRSVSNVRGPLSPEYAPKFGQLFFGSKIEWTGAFAGSALAFLFLSIFAAGLSTLKRSPLKFETLPSEIILPFFYPNHLATSPEALGMLLNRKDYLSSILHFYNSFADMLMGWDNFGQKYMYDSTIEKYKGNYLIHKEEMASITENQEKVDENLADKPFTANFQIPSIIGESTQGKVLRMIDKVEKLHDYLEANIADKRSMNEEFAKEGGYQFSEYQNISPGQAKLSNIRVFSLLTDEQTMYKESVDLAKVATILRKKIYPNGIDFSGYEAPIGVPHLTRFASYLPPETLRSDDGKMELIVASRYGSTPKKIREPIIGKIDGRLVEQVVDKNKYEIQVCYELALRKNKDITGQMIWTWIIDSRGLARDLKVNTDDTKNSALTKCIEQKILSWKFPRPDRGSVQVSFPFSFSRNKG